MTLASKRLISAENVNLKLKGIELLISPCICFGCGSYENGSKSILVIPYRRTETRPVSLHKIVGGLWIRNHLLSQGTQKNHVKYALTAQSETTNEGYKPTYIQAFTVWYLLLVRISFPLSLQWQLMALI